MKDLPDRIVLTRKEHGMGGDQYILVFLPHNEHTPFVTWYEDTQGVTYLGHYHTDLAEAVEDFHSR